MPVLKECHSSNATTPRLHLKQHIRGPTSMPNSRQHLMKCILDSVPVTKPPLAKHYTMRPLHAAVFLALDTRSQCPSGASLAYCSEEGCWHEPKHIEHLDTICNRAETALLLPLT